MALAATLVAQRPASHASSAMEADAGAQGTRLSCTHRDLKQLGWTPLHAACSYEGAAGMWRGQIEVARLLIQKGAKVDAVFPKVCPAGSSPVPSTGASQPPASHRSACLSLNAGHRPAMMVAAGRQHAAAPSSGAGRAGARAIPAGRGRRHRRRQPGACARGVCQTCSREVVPLRGGWRGWELTSASAVEELQFIPAQLPISTMPFSHYCRPS